MGVRAAQAAWQQQVVRPSAEPAEQAQPLLAVALPALRAVAAEQRCAATFVSGAGVSSTFGSAFASMCGVSGSAFAASSITAAGSSTSGVSMATISSVSAGALFRSVRREYTQFAAEPVGKTILNCVRMRCYRHAHVLQFANDFGIVAIQLAG